MSAFRLIAAEKANHPVSVLCEQLGVSRSGFHAWERRAPSDRRLADAWLLEQIKEIHEANRRVYGAPRIHAELRLARGIRVSRKRVERLMSQAGISGLVPKRRGRTTIRVPGVRVADDLVDRRFRPEAPNVLWCADITYLRSWEGWLSLRPQFVALGFGQECAKAGIARSMGSRGDCWDNAVAESFFATLKRELADRADWHTRDEARTAVFEYIEVWYNQQRRHSSLGYQSPVEYEQQLASAQAIENAA